MNALANTAVVVIQRRPARLRDEPVQRAAGRPWSSPPALLLHRPTPTCIRRDSGENCVAYRRVHTDARSSVLDRRQQQLTDTMAVEADYVYVGGGVTRRTSSTEQRQPDLRSGHRRQLSLLGHQLGAPSPTGARYSMSVMGGRSNSHSLQTSVHQTVEQPLAGVGHLYAVVPLRHVGAGLQWRSAVPFPVQPDLGSDYTFSRPTSATGRRSTASGRWAVGSN